MAWIFQDYTRKKKLGEVACPWSVGWLDPDGNRKSATVGTKEAAIKRQGAIEEQLRKGTYEDKSRMKWADFRDEYMRRIAPKWRSDVSALEVQRAFDLVEELIKPRYVRQINSKQLDQYVADRLQMRGKRKGDKVSPATILKELRAIRAALNVARKWRYITTVPEMPEVDCYRRDKPFVTEEHFNLILNNCDAAKFPQDQHYKSGDFWRALLGLAMITGMRKSAMLALEWSDVNLDEGVAVSHAEDNKGKRDQRHNIEPVADLLGVLHRVRQPGDERVFAWNHATITLSREHARIQEAAGIHLPCRTKHEHTKYCHLYGFHAYRYGFAQYNSEHLTSDQLQEQMGHKSGTTTRGYIDYAKRQKLAKVKVHVPAGLRDFTGQRSVQNVG
jgi:integrase